MRASQWVRAEICEKENHSHGPDGETECWLGRLAELRAAAGKGGG